MESKCKEGRDAQEANQGSNRASSEEREARDEIKRPAGPRDAPPNKHMQRRPRSEFLIVPLVSFAAPLMRGVGRHST